MIEIDIPGREDLKIENVVFDYNGTVAVDGVINVKIKEMIKELSEYLKIYIITADTYGNVRSQCEGLPVIVETFSKGNATFYKKQFVKKIGAKFTMTVGNGLNDVEMFKVSALSIAVIEEEGCASEAIMNSNITVKNIKDVFNMIMKKARIKATLRD